MKQIQTYTYTIAANGSVQVPATNDNFIILAASGPVTVRGDTFGTLPNLVAGQGLKAVTFNRLELKDASGAPNTVTLLMAPAEFVNQVFSGSVSIVPTDIALLQQPQRLATSYVDSSGLLANTAKNVFTAGVNLNGAILLSATGKYQAGPTIFSYGATLLAKATAPASLIDGHVIAGDHVSVWTGNLCERNFEVFTPQFIPAGLGLWFICSDAAQGLTAARYILL